ncbi:hypothetical protein MPSEU_000940700 [Mayamaea pseudoterrestris]|nr:hypothetical protein MPSEU_000940700 [Mayamaea pseudoterrestris]
MSRLTVQSIGLPWILYDDQQLYNNHGIPSVTMDSVDKLSVSVPGKLIPPLSAHDEAPMGHQHKALDSDGESADGTLASERFVSDIKLLAIDEPVLVDALVSEHASVISDAISRCTTEDCIDELLLQILEHVVKKRRQLRLSLKHKIRTNDLLPENHQELGDKDSELWSMGNDQFKLRAERRSDHAAHQDERSSTSTLLDDVRLSVNETSNASVVGHAAMLAAGDPARGERCCYGSYEGDKTCAHSFPDHLDDKICNSANNPPVEPMFLDKRRAMESTNLQPTSLESSSLIVNDEFNGEISFGTKLKLDETSSMRCENACRPDTKVMSSGKMVMLILIVSAYCALIFFGWEIQCTAARLTSFLRFLVALRLFVFKFVASLLGFDQGRVKRGFDFDEGDYTEEELAWICADGGAARQASLDEQQFKTDRATDEDHILGTASQTCASRPTSIGAAKLAHFRACKEHDRMVEASRRSG